MRVNKPFICRIILVRQKFHFIPFLKQKLIYDPCVSICKQLTIKWKLGLHTYIDNLEQKVRGKFIKLSKTGISVECFAADLLQIFTKKPQNLLFGGWLGTSHQIQSSQGFSGNFPDFLRSTVLSRSVILEATRTFTFW